MTWIDEAKKRNPMESAIKYVELMKDYNIDRDHQDEELMCELDILWESATNNKESKKYIEENLI